MYSLLVKLRSNFATILILLIGITFSIYLNTYHIEFGLPHSFHADEPEIAELAVKYTFELKSIISNKDYYKLIPISYVYGTVPAYFFTIFTMLFSKVHNLLDLTFDKTSIYIFLRTLNAFISSTLLLSTFFLYKKLFSHEGVKRETTLLIVFLTALNWKYILHAHYLNVDLIITVLLSITYSLFICYIHKKNDTKYTVLSAVFYGLAVGTKVTVLLTLPIFVLVFLFKKDIRNMFAFLFLIFGVFVLSNPFSLVFANDFVFRVLQLSVKENGLVFDSVDYGYFKYLFGLVHIIGIELLILSFSSIYIIYSKRKSLTIELMLSHMFLLLTVLFYIIFFTLGSRRVDRWLLPLVPIFIVYGVNGLYYFKSIANRRVYIVALAIIMLNYTYKPLLLLTQLNTNTPKSEAYLWMRDNLSSESNKLVITEEGLDPMNKLQSTYVLNYQVYESENAQFKMPENAIGYDYVVLSSRPMQNFKRPEVKNKFPFYYDKWNSFEQDVLDENKFELVKEYKLPKPNLLEVSDVYIYKSVNFK